VIAEIDLPKMKIAVAMLLSLLLAGTPFALPARAAACGEAAACKSCCAGKADCCAAPAPQAPASPAVPASAPTQNEWQAVAVVLHLLTALDTFAPQSLTSVSFAPPGATAVPIYQRDCQYLV
jgi:hypothetical protein